MDLERKRSSCASGSGYVPSCSIGLRVAKTWNGSGSACVVVPTVTLRSCIAWSSAACVFGGVRLISSARTRLWKIGPAQEAHAAVHAALVVLVLLEHVGAGDVGRQEIGRELHASERQIERLARATRRAASWRAPGRRRAAHGRAPRASPASRSTTSLLPRRRLAANGSSELRPRHRQALSRSARSEEAAWRSGESAIGHGRCRVFSTTLPRMRHDNTPAPVNACRARRLCKAELLRWRRTRPYSLTAPRRGWSLVGGAIIVAGLAVLRWARDGISAAARIGRRPASKRRRAERDEPAPASAHRGDDPRRCRLRRLRALPRHARDRREPGAVPLVGLCARVRARLRQLPHCAFSSGSTTSRASASAASPSSTACSPSSRASSSRSPPARWARSSSRSSCTDPRRRGGSKTAPIVLAERLTDVLGIVDPHRRRGAPASRGARLGRASDAAWSCAARRHQLGHGVLEWLIGLARARPRTRAQDGPRSRGSLGEPPHTDRHRAP